MTALFRSTSSHLLLLLLLVSLPGIVVIYYHAENERVSTIEDAEQKAVEIGRQLAFAQKEIIDKTQSYLQYLVTTSQVQNPSSSECTAFLQSILKLNNTFINIGIPKPDGELLCNALPLSRKVNVFDRAYFQRSLTKRSFAIGTFQFDRAAQKTSLNFSYPIISQSDSSVTGIAVAVVSLDWWSKKLAEFGLPEGSAAYISDTKNNIVASFPIDPKKHGNSLSNYGLNLSFLNKNMLYRELVTGEDGVNRIFIHDIFYENWGGQNVTVSVGIPIGQDLNDANKNFIFTLAIFTAFMVIVTLIAIRILNKSIIRPIEKLTMAANTLEEGGLPDRLEHTGSREIIALKGNFENMAAKRLETERSAVSRTEELNAVFDALPDLFFKLNAEGVIIDYKASEFLPFYTSPDQFMGKKLVDVLPENSCDILKDIFKERLESKMLITWEYPQEVGNITMHFEARATSIQYSNEIIVVIRDVTERKRADEKLERIAHYDILTNLPNRVLLADRLSHAMVQCQRRNQSLAVVYMDLDGFKVVNDTYGHDLGDKLLVELSKRMKEALREGDTLARIGGDEFIAIMVDLESSVSSKPILERLLKTTFEPVTLNDTAVQVSLSIGVTLYPQDGADAEQLIRHADQAMYVAKQSGKNRYQLFDAAQDSAIKIQQQSIGEVRSALVKREFVLHYQPKVNMNAGEVIGVEALIRWQHPDRGLVPPLEFLPAIEGHDISIELGEWVIDTALTQISQWRTMGLDLAISVNISAYQLQQDNFVTRLATLLAAHPGVNPCYLELEVLETSALNDISRVSATMNECHDLGVRFALDDFGTGYSSLTHLRRLPAYLIKIDQTFVRDMLEDADDLAIIEGIVALAKSFQREVIAEGVETIEHGVALLQLGCELAQGYGIARPMPADDIPEWVRSWKVDDSWQTVSLNEAN